MSSLDNLPNEQKKDEKPINHVAIKCPSCENTKNFSYTSVTQSQKPLTFLFVLIWIICILVVAFFPAFSKNSSSTIIEKIGFILIGTATSFSVLKFLIILTIIRILQPFKVTTSIVAICPECGYSWEIRNPKTFKTMLQKHEEALFKNSNDKK